MIEENGIWAGIKETVKTVVYALLIAGLFRTILFQPFWIPSGSMKDTLLIGDFLFVNKMVYGYSYASCPSIKPIGIDAEDFCGVFKGKGRLFGAEPERGDVVVFRHPVTGEDYIKRLIGLPGDTVEMRDGILIINGTPVEVEADGFFIETFELQGPQRRQPDCSQVVDGECYKAKFVETLPNGVKHSILNVRDNAGADKTSVFVVEPEHYFFMGDNRDNSVDSRFPQTGLQVGVGLVPAENLIGRADRVIFSSAGRSMLAFWTWRGDRFFTAIE